MTYTEIDKKAGLFAKLQPSRARKRINATYSRHLLAEPCKTLRSGLREFRLQEKLALEKEREQGESPRGNNYSHLKERNVQ